MKKVIIIMTKVPEAGKVKTRLQPYLSAEKCAEFAENLLRDAIEKTSSSQNQLIIAFSPMEMSDYFQKFSQYNFILTPQKGLNLGEKMFNAFDFAFRQNIDSAVMIGTDSPTFPPEFIGKAFEFLKKSDVVLGESEDGGYYLIGLTKLQKEIFENVVWSSPKTFKQTVENIEKCGLKLSFVQKWYDVDLPEHFERLKNVLIKNPNLAPFTANWMKKNSLTSK